MCDFRPFSPKREETEAIQEKNENKPYGLGKKFVVAVVGVLCIWFGIEF